MSSSNLETRLWLDRTGDPEGVVTWNSSVAHYASSRASEWAVHSRLHHNSFDKVRRRKKSSSRLVSAFRNLSFPMLIRATPQKFVFFIICC